MTNRLVQHITVNESTSILRVNEYGVFSVRRPMCFSFENDSKYLHPSSKTVPKIYTRLITDPPCETGLDFKDCFKRDKTNLTAEFQKTLSNIYFESF